MAEAAPLTFALGEYGREIRKDLRLDLSAIGGMSVSYEAQKPDGTTVSWSASVLEVAEGHSSISYTLASGDLDQSGLWVIRPKVTSPSLVLFGDAFPLLVKGMYEL